MSKMRPGKLPLTIAPGVPWALALAMDNPLTGAPLPLTAFAPFKCEIRTKIGGTLLATVTVDASEAADAKLTLSLSGEATAALRGRAVHDVIDAMGNRWLEGPVHFDPNVTQL